MNDLERWVILANAVMAFIAMFVNAGTSHATPEPWRSVRIPIAVLAAIYCVAYLWLFIAEDSVEAADRLLDQIRDDSRTLLLQPKMGRARDELAVGLRSWPTSTPYILFYFV